MLGRSAWVLTLGIPSRTIDMAPPVIALKNIQLTFGGAPLFEGCDLQVLPGDRIGLVGRNGSGKSTLLKIAAGLIEADDGEIFKQPGAKIAYLRQEPDLSAYATVLDYAEDAFPEGEDPYKARLLLNELGLEGDERPGEISGGQARRAALAAALAPGPDVLLLDEPTNHLDLPAIEWLEKELAKTRAALVLISHDRAFLKTLTTKTVWIDRGQSRELNQGFGAFEEWRDTVFEQEQLERHKLDRKIARELAWMHDGGVTARRKRNMRRVAELANLRKQRKDARAQQGTVKMEVTSAGITGKLVVEAKNISKSYDGRTLIDDFSIRIARGDRVALAGPNGSGKTTMLRMLTGVLEPDSGSIRHGANLEIITLEQNRESLDPNTTVSDTLTGGRGDSVVVNGASRHVASYLKDFLFQPEQMRSAVSALSGGERARLMLARALAKPSNVLVLDEPTNDLDLETLDLLQELVADYPGTVLLVSHDRDFLDRTATSLITQDAAGRWQEYAGGYTDMLAQRGAIAGAESTRSQDGATGSTAQTPRRRDAASAPPRKGKLSFKDKHELETLPKTIDKLTAEIAKLASKLADPELFKRDPDQFHASSQKIGKLETQKSNAEERWMELEMKREELNG
jgi:ABC transport system ATP-binding/permease protein